MIQYYISYTNNMMQKEGIGAHYTTSHVIQEAFMQSKCVDA